MSSEIVVRTREMEDILKELRPPLHIDLHPLELFKQHTTLEIRQACLEAMRRCRVYGARVSEGQRIARQLIAHDDLLAQDFMQALLFSCWGEEQQDALKFFLEERYPDSWAGWRSKVVYGRVRDQSDLYPTVAEFVKLELRFFFDWIGRYPSYREDEWHRLERAAKLALEFEDYTCLDILTLILRRYQYRVEGKPVQASQSGISGFMLPVLRAQHVAFIQTIVSILRKAQRKSLRKREAVV